MPEAARSKARAGWSPPADENDFTVVSIVTYSSGAADLTSEVLQLKDANADVLIADQYVSDAILLTNTMAEQGYKPAIMICKGNKEELNFKS